ncbi:MAG TPA: YfhO family protein [Bacteroidota bacterium]|nr:YfhO family protein [Bacteroidota bacterium]
MATTTAKQSGLSKHSAVEHDLIPEKYQHATAIAIIYVSILIFFYAMVFEGKVYQSSDSLPVWDTFLHQVEQEGAVALWNPYLFCGMPGYAALMYPVPQSFDITINIWEHIGRGGIGFLFMKEQNSGAYLLFYLVYGIGMYVLSYRFLKRKPIAVLVALMSMYATYVAMYIMMGHTTKLAVLCWFPFVFLVVDKLREKFNLVLAFTLPVLIRLMLQASHVQFLYYMFLALGLYLLYFLILAIRKKENIKHVAASCITFILAAGIAFLMGATQYFSTMEYNPYSIRGSNPIQTSAAASTATSSSKTVEGGLDYDYATQWSFGPGELMTFFIPSWCGFGPMPYEGPLTQNQAVKLNLYWGPQPFVDGPQYMGIIAVVFALVGLYRYRKDPFVQYMGAIILFALLLSFGKEFSLVYDLMYHYAPYFNKFRIPSMSLMLVQFFTPILAGYGIVSFLPENKKSMTPEQTKRWKYVFLALAGLFVLVLLGKDIVKSFYQTFYSLQEIGTTLSNSFRQQLSSDVVGMIFDFVFSSIISDIMIAVALLAAAFGACYTYQKGKMRSITVYGIFLVAILFDLWRVASKPHDAIMPQEAKEAVATPDYVQALQHDTTQYRVLRLVNGQPVYDNTLAYWKLHNAYGYHAAKMRAYQDMVDVAGMGNPRVWQLMNIKYLISNRPDSNSMLIPVYQDKESFVYAFRFWMPHVFFVNKYQVADGITTLNNISLMSFEPQQTAFVTEQLSTTIDAPKEGASATLTSYRTQDLEIHATATGNNLLFISDAYYPKGWKAFIDGKETAILRVDYLFRGIVVPPGVHTITMKFEPQMYATGKIISTILSVLVWGGVLILGGWKFWKRRKSTLA